MKLIYENAKITQHRQQEQVNQQQQVPLQERYSVQY